MRTHLAGGCADCLEELFAQPVGWPASASDGQPSGPARRVRRQSAGRLPTAVVLALGVALAALVAWTISDLQRREMAARLEALRAGHRLAEDAAEVAAQAARVTALERELATARDELARLHGAAETATRLRDELAAAEERVAALLRDMDRRDVELERLRMGAAERQSVRDLLATPGVEVLPLAAVPPYRDVRGHVLWHPARPVVVLYAFGLPAGGYRVRLRLDDGRAVAVPLGRQSPDGDAALPVRLATVGAKLRDVTVVRAQGQEILAGYRP